MRVEVVLYRASAFFEKLDERLGVVDPPLPHRLEYRHVLTHLFEREVVEPEHVVKDRIHHFAGAYGRLPVGSRESYGFFHEVFRGFLNDLVERRLPQFHPVSGSELEDVFGI